MDLNQDDASSFINEPDIVPPSPPSGKLDLDKPHPPPFPRDYPTFGSPSFNGSHYSPFSGHSELSFGGDQEYSLDFFSDDGSSNGLGLSLEYNPNEYDGPSASSLLIYNDTDFMANYAALSPSAGAEPRSGAHDYSSPSSNASGNESGKRSRESSVVSTPALQFSPSPRLDVAQSFENMSFHSPNWGTEPLPPKAPSPPRLMMPDNFPVDSQPPKINVPDGDDPSSHPQFNIVPATPIGGGEGNSHPIPFQSTLETLHQGTTLSFRSQQWADVNQQSPSVAGQSNSAPSDHRIPPPSVHSHSDTTPPASTSASSASRILDNNTVTTDNTYLFAPNSQRTRSKSDTSRELPLWDQSFVQQQTEAQDLGGSAVDEQTVNMNDVLPGTQAPQLNPSFSFGGSRPSSFLSPDPNAIRRVKSESGARPMHHRLSHSEDFSAVNAAPTFQPSHQHTQSQSSTQYLFPPGPRDFLNPNAQFYNSVGSPDRPAPPISMQPSQRSASPGHIRRASSGSRSERGAETWSGPSGPLPPKRISPYPSPNASPHVRYNELPYDDSVPLNIGMNYPNTNLSGSALLDTSTYNPQKQPQGFGSGYNFPNSGSFTPLSGNSVYHTPEASPAPAPPLQLDMSVPKLNVTTGRTAKASHQRRKQEATFFCPVPGCGSSFTRAFNLKGHLRSHNDEKPYSCHWPGCNKGFARQHDCKRHEQLHTNYRPFNCEGCGKHFARMDALNRHLRSEGGAECQKYQEAKEAANGGQTTTHDMNGNATSSSTMLMSNGHDGDRSIQEINGVSL